MDNKGNALRQQMNETRAGLTGKLEELEHQVSGTVRTVTNSVNTVRDSFDVKLQVRRHPWTFVAGAAVLGFIGGFRPSRRDNGRSAHGGETSQPPPSCATPVERPYSNACENVNSGVDGKSVGAAVPTWLANLSVAFQPEIAELRGIVIGGLVELVREMLAKQAAKPNERNAPDRVSGGHEQQRARTANPAPPRDISDDTGS